ncbi:ABC transporter ATP-binding protein [Catenovulum agarivorans DS-2]|uniref:ABC transporter ATP-binding protein n=1 Tax=Catenovulum agarivorans DS-2 TaxID=1328313 RepID=W7QJE5_9ALTE|nr:ABC transporter substrate-binding protein [Catenovulum agarivorans]EWH08273.1 ABC transporter ATP-binding protein [Catenovulum agarivorans DS-2]
MFSQTKQSNSLVKTIGCLILTSMLMMFAANAKANPSDPNQFLNQVGQNLFSEIKQLKLDEKQKRIALQEIIDKQLMPHIDLTYVSYKLLGKHVRKVNKQQAQQFVKAVERYLTLTYANALMSYKGQQVIFEQNGQVEEKYATVKTRIVDPNAPAIDIHFKMRKNSKGEWKVYDMVAEGISLLGAKQSEISKRISDVGIDKVIAELAS